MFNKLICLTNKTQNEQSNEKSFVGLQCSLFINAFSNTFTKGTRYQVFGAKKF